MLARKRKQKAREGRLYREVLAIEAQAARRATTRPGTISIRDARAAALHDQGLRIAP